MSAVVRAYAVAMLVLLAAYMVLYARYFAWAGDFAWGDRYIERSGVVCDAGGAAAVAVPARSGARGASVRVVRGGGECHDSGGVAGVLAAAGDLSDRRNGA